MLSQCWTVNAKVSYTEVHEFGSEPCRLLWLALHAAGLSYMGMLACAHRAVPAPSPTPFRHSLHTALCFRDYIVRTLFEMPPIKCLLEVNEGKLTLLNLPKEASTRQKLMPFLFLVDLSGVDFFMSST